jgi:ribosomal silencing factor RsfS
VIQRAINYLLKSIEVSQRNTLEIAEQLTQQAMALIQYLPENEREEHQWQLMSAQGIRIHIINLIDVLICSISASTFLV